MTSVQSKNSLEWGVFTMILMVDNVLIKWNQIRCELISIHGIIGSLQSADRLVTTS